MVYNLICRTFPIHMFTCLISTIENFSFFCNFLFIIYSENLKKGPSLDHMSRINTQGKIRKFNRHSGRSLFSPQKQPFPDVLQRRCSWRFLNFTGKHLRWSSWRPANLLKRDSSTGVFLWILKIYPEQLLQRTSVAASVSDYFTQFILSFFSLVWLSGESSWKMEERREEPE